MSNQTLAGKTALVTGGGRGIGAAVARRFASAGASIVVSARSQAEIEAVAAELSRDGATAAAIPCDVTDADQVSRLAAQAIDRFGPIHVLVNNAGVSDSAPLHRITLDAWNRLMATNATGPFLVTQQIVPGMREAGWGRIVNVASIAGLTGAKYIAAYTASKHAVVGFTRALAVELADSGVTVNAVCPGYVDTSMTNRSIARIVEKTGMSEGQVRDAILARSPQGRLIEPDEVAHVVASLCDDDARGINGQTIVVDGGATLV